MKILVLNSGSSSQKSCLYEVSDSHLPEASPVPIWQSTADWSHHPGQVLVKTTTSHGTFEADFPFATQGEVTHRLLDSLYQGKSQVVNTLAEIDIVGHRVVHGGPNHRHSMVITSELKQAIAQYGKFAPLHNPSNLEGITVVEQRLDVPQVAVFDTAFHGELPAAAAVYPGPYEWRDQDIQRYGFHGISYQYCAQRTAKILSKPLADLHMIVCHLGNGCSVCAIREGRSVDTTMGFTPLEGLMMGTRSGSVDPGILIYLLRHQGCSVDELEQILNKQSGLKGISGLSSDMRQLLAAIQSPEGNPRAQLALEIFIHRLRSSIGAMLPQLERLDALVFTAGIGENSAWVRKAACDGFGFLGLQLDVEKNECNPIDVDLATAESAVRILVIHTEEDWQIAQDCWKILKNL